MKLVAMMIVHNEADRYLRPCLDSLLTFVDEVRILDDASTDDFREIDWYPDERVVVQRLSEPAFFLHEGRARQALLEWAMQGDPTHILAIDADEFISDGALLRAAMEEGNQAGVWGPVMQEVWKVDETSLSIRQDGGWKQHPVGVAFEVPVALRTNQIRNRQQQRQFRIPDRALACGRVPLLVAVRANRVGQGGAAGEILHFGWACEADRQKRYLRYVEHDGGRFHRNTHLESIMWDDSRVELTTRAWPESIPKGAVLKRASRLPFE